MLSIFSWNTHLADNQQIMPPGDLRNKLLRNYTLVNRLLAFFYMGSRLLTIKLDRSLSFNAFFQIWKKGAWYLAKCPELDFVSQGRTRQEAQDNLMEVIEIQFKEMSRMGTLEEYLDECGYELRENVAIPQTEMVGFEKLDMQVY